MSAQPPVISLVTTCKGRLDHLRQTLPLMTVLGPLAQVVVVDFDCPQNTGDWVKANQPSAVVVEARDRPLFSASAARNLGAAAATAPWLFFIDADVLAPPTLLADILPHLSAGTFLIPELRTRGLWGAVVVASDDFTRIGGYDDAFQNWGGEDDDLLIRLQQAGLESRTFNSPGLDYIEHDNALRTRHHAEQNLPISSQINSFYLGVKADLARLQVTLSPRDREVLYADIRAKISQAMINGEAQLLQVTFRQAWAGAAPTHTSLCYEIRRGLQS